MGTGRQPDRIRSRSMSVKIVIGYRVAHLTPACFAMNTVLIYIIAHDEEYGMNRIRPLYNGCSAYIRRSLHPNSLRLFRCSLLALVIALFPNVTYSTCNERAIHRYQEQGKTLRSIANRCGMEIDEVREILEDDKDDTDGKRDSLPSVTQDANENAEASGIRPHRYPPGTPVSQCGCWGTIWPGQQIPNNSCRSGTSIAIACQMQCPNNGGNMWYTICG